MDQTGKKWQPSLLGGLKMSPKYRALIASIIAAMALALMPDVSAQKKLTVGQFISPAYPFELISAKKADRLAWIAYERGMRNVYTAAAPDFKPVKLTSVTADDGNDMTGTQISDDGSIVLFVRGHAPNRDGWIANPTSDPDGGERAVWAARTSGLSKPWKVVVTTSNPALSPNGQWVLFTKDGQIHRAAINQQRALSEVDKGEKPFFRVYGTNSNPRWSPDGTKIAFVSNRSDHSFIAIYDIEKQTVSYLSPNVDFDTSPTWSPDGKRIAFIRRPGLTFGQLAQQSAANAPGQGRGGPGGGRQGGPGTGRAGAPPQTATQGQQQGQRGAGQQGQQGAANQQSRIRGMDRALFKGGYNLSFWVADVATGEAKEFWHNAPEERVFNGINNIQWAGENVIFQLEPEEWIRYYSVPVSGGRAEPITLTPGNGMVENIALSSDGKHLFYCTNAGDIDRRHIWRVPTAGGEAKQISSGTDIETYPAALASGEKVAVLFAGAKLPQSVAVLPAAGNGKAQIIFPTLPKDFPMEEHVVPENVTLKAEDGLEFNNQLFLPKDIRPGERRPALIFVHGGPQRQMLLGYHYRHVYHMFYGVNQYLASQGYVVMSVNFRSGIGYGKSFRMAQRTGRRGNSEYQDVLAAGKYLQSRPDVDPKRVGIWGLSYGGLLTAQALARNSDIFVAGVDMAGVHLWGSSVDPNDIAFQSSPISAIEKWKSPVLLIHGDDDRNVAFSQTGGLVQLLRAHGVHHELIILPDDVHDSLLHSRWIQCLDAMDDFFKRYLKNGGETKGGSSVQ
jgi:dipeptidyl aminopeptidase/acylaminoacyl peptidase